jgi:hypothetical protein
LDQAKAAYELAAQAAEEHRRQADARGVSHAFERANQTKERARRHYADLLQAFTDLIVHGTIPPGN